MYVMTANSTTNILLMKYEFFFFWKCLSPINYGSQYITLKSVTQIFIL